MRRAVPGSDAFTTALTWLSARELSESQIRTRLRRREFPPDDIDSAISRLKSDGTINDTRVAMALGRMESSIRQRGRARVIQKIRQAGIDDDTAQAAVDKVFEDVNEDDLLDRALQRRLRGKAPAELDDKGKARIVRGLVAQGFRLDAVLKRLRT
ncbi:MAG TPA: regulatory protein RecX [Vicinamibacterales bacterium]|nr:regulatory protein RecX [Vicinamibacterales bacterium]